LAIIAGISQPSSGKVVVNGRVAALLELGAGFNPEFTGRDNVYLNGAVMGLTRRQIDERYQAIESFAEIGEFIRRPVRTYSSGMVVRLAFAVAIHVDPEILLIDEALAVGDHYFRQRCLRQIHELRSRGVTIIYVSHSMAEVTSVGDRALWLEAGRAAGLGDTAAVVSSYTAAMAQKDSAWRQHGPGTGTRPVEGIPNIDHRHGDGRAEVIGIAVLGPDGSALPLLEPQSSAVVRISIRSRERVGRPVAGFLLRNHLGIAFSGADTAGQGLELPPLDPGEVWTFDFPLEIPELYPGAFSFSPFLADGAPPEHRVCDWIDNAVTLQMTRSGPQIYGMLHLPCRVEWNATLAP
ncbi:MAG: ABC transporter ATP-binding protein, partial [Acidobacteria bacterium]|nr:ABC transporter ATP-binding protein [Acidobacteriota bacterium]